MATKKSIPPKRRTDDLKGRFSRTLAWVEFTIAKYRQEHHITDGGEAALDSIASSSAVNDLDLSVKSDDSKGLGTATALQYDRYMQRNADAFAVCVDAGEQLRAHGQLDPCPFIFCHVLVPFLA